MYYGEGDGGGGRGGGVLGFFFLRTNLREIPVIQSYNGSDLAAQQMINQIVVVLNSSFVDMISWELNVKNTFITRPFIKYTCVCVVMKKRGNFSLQFPLYISD